MKMHLSTLAFLSAFFSYAAVAGFQPINNGRVDQVSAVTAAASTTTLTAASNQVQVIEGSTTQSVKLPSAILLPIDWFFDITNNSTGTVTVKDNSGATLGTLLTKQVGHFVLSARSTAAGTWRLWIVAGVNSVGAIPGVAAFADSLSANPTDCSVSGSFATGIDAQGNLTCSVPVAGSGDVTGPSSATDNAIARFDGTTGKLVQNSGATIDDSGNVTATSFIGPVTGNALTATALAANPAACSAGDFVTDIAANGTLTCATPSAGGVTTMAAVGATPNANGASISGSTLTLQPASSTLPGAVTAGTQTFGGSKTFNTAMTVQAAAINSDVLKLQNSTASNSFNFHFGATGTDFWMEQGCCVQILTFGSGNFSIYGSRAPKWQFQLEKASTTTTLNSVFASNAGESTFAILNTTATANNFSAIAFVGNSISGTSADSGIYGKHTSHTSGAESGVIGLATRNAGGTMTSGLEISATQALKLPAYGAGTLVTDASGNVTATAAAGGDSISKSITQATHGLAVGDWVYYTGSAYAKADADADSTAEVLGVVSAVADVNTFTLLSSGYVSVLSGLTAGTTYYLSGTAGALTATAPTTSGAVSKPVLVAVSTTAGYVIHSRGIVVGGSGAVGSTSVLTKTTDYTILTSDFSASGSLMIEANCAAACTITFPAATNTGFRVQFSNVGNAIATGQLAGSDVIGGTTDQTFVLAPGMSGNALIANGVSRWNAF